MCENYYVEANVTVLQLQKNIWNVPYIDSISFSCTRSENARAAEISRPCE